MKCPTCGYPDSKVIDSRPTEEGSIKRRRECTSCKRRFTTYEIIDAVPITVKKKNGSEEIFDAIRQGHIAYIINTKDISSAGEESDGHQIRRCATENNATIFTSLDTVRVLLDVLEETTLTISTIDA